MKKPDELFLLAALLAGEWPRDAGNRLNIHTRRVEALCHKWTRAGWYNYGVAADLGWVTDEGRRAIAQLLTAPAPSGQSPTASP